MAGSEARRTLYDKVLYIADASMFQGAARQKWGGFRAVVGADSEISVVTCNLVLSAVYSYNFTTLLFTALLAVQLQRYEACAYARVCASAELCSAPS